MISVIIPCYNSERTIKRCVSSVIKQTFKDFEIIIVNDCSTDKSIAILTNLQKRYSERIILLNKTNNEGVDQARFDGLKQAKGDFITFLDADDWLESRTLEVMSAAMDADDFDYVEVGMARVFGKYGWIKKKTIPSVVGEIYQPELFDKYYISFFGVNILPVNIWGKLYRKSFLDSVPLKPSRLAMGEDLYFNLTLFPYLKKIKIIDFIGYNYRFGGMTTRYNPYLLPNLEKLYCIKRNLAETFHYEKAIPFLLIELKNVLRSDIKQQIQFRYSSKECIIENCRNLFFKNESFQSVYNYYTKVNLKEKNLFVDAIRQQNFEQMYNVCLMEVQRERMTRFIKRITNLFFQYI